MEWVDKDNAVLMNNLQVLQNKAAKLVLDKPLYSSATDALNQLGWLNINLKQHRHFYRWLYVCKCVNGITSHKFELLRSSDVHRYSTHCKNDLRLPSFKRKKLSGCVIVNLTNTPGPTCIYKQRTIERKDFAWICLRLQAFYMVCEHTVSHKAQDEQHFCLKGAY